MKLAIYMKKESVSDAVFAKQLEVNRATVSKWRRDKVKPGRKGIIKVAEATQGKVQFKDWL